MQTLKVIIIGAVLAFVIVLMPGHTVAQQATTQPPPETQAKPVEVVQNDSGVKIKLNFQDAPLQTVLEYLSDAAGLTIISDEPLYDGRITVISRQPIPLDEAITLVNSILKERSLTTILRGKTLKVVTLEKAKTENIPVFSGQDPDVIVPSDDVVHYVIPVRHVTATALKENLQALLPEYASLEANEDGNALIMTDTTANIKRIMQIIKALDTHMSSVAEIRVFRLVNAEATSAATLINTMFQQDQQGGTRGRQGARNPMEMMMQRMGRGGPGGGPGGRGGVGGRDGDSGGGQSQTSGGSLNVQVVAAADERTNSVVVRGPAETLDIVDSMIKQLEDTTAKVAGVKIFQLRYADAMNTAEMINQLFGDESGSSQNQQGGPMMFRGPGGRGPRMDQGEETGGTTKVSAAADSQTNTVVVTGPDDILEVVAEVVKNLDSQLPNVADVKVFHLEYADAQDTAELINEVFGESRTSSQTTRSSGRQGGVQFMRGGPGGGFPGMQQSSQSSGSISDVAIIASADSRTNSVVVSGPTETLQIITGVIKELDENPEQERKIFVYALKNANAENLKEIINNLFAEIQALNQAGSTTGQQFQGQRGGQQPSTQTAQASDSSTSNDLSEDTYLEADTDTNSLLVLTSTRNYALLKPIIDELDKPIGQVLIKVLFAEITHGNDIDLGTEFSVWNLRGAGDSNNVQFSTVFPPSPTSGLTATVLDRTLDVTIRALQETSKLNILSRPYILASNNQTATITVGQQVPYATGESLTTGQSQTTTEYRDVGIILEVTPSINPDGLVNMTVRPEISSTTGEEVQISENLTLPVFATRTSETKVAIRDGQTIVIGGLMQDEVRDTIRKVPFLGSVPILGSLFRRTIKETDKTELLIFLTPHVAPDALALTPISDRERKRSNLLDDETVSDIFKKHIGAMENTDVEETKSKK
jgi:general secretion pathway protein D